MWLSCTRVSLMPRWVINTCTSHTVHFVQRCSLWSSLWRMRSDFETNRHIATIFLMAAGGVVSAVSIADAGAMANGVFAALTCTMAQAQAIVWRDFNFFPSQVTISRRCRSRHSLRHFLTKLCWYRRRMRLGLSLGRPSTG